jgi:hypothetical protein
MTPLCGLEAFQSHTNAYEDKRSKKRKSCGAFPIRCLQAEKCRGKFAAENEWPKHYGEERDDEGAY